MKKSFRILISVFSLTAAIPWALQSHAQTAREKQAMSSPRSVSGSIPEYDVCNLDLIYSAEDGGYKHSLPRNILESYLSGVAFDNKTAYNQDELKQSEEDIKEIFNNIMSQNPMKEKIAIITAGGPGAGKTFLLEQYIAQEKGKGRIYAYVDPDEVSLKNQKRTYLADIEKYGDSKETRTAAYNKWRPLSNGSNELNLAHIRREGRAFAFGTTSTSPRVGLLFDYLKKEGYIIHLLHLTTPDEVRWASVENHKFLHTTKEDITQKGLMLPQRINDYIKYADVIEFYYRAGANENAKLGATWTRNADSSEALGTLNVADEALYENIKNVHNTGITALNKPELSWEKTVEAQSKFAATGK